MITDAVAWREFDPDADEKTGPHPHVVVWVYDPDVYGVTLAAPDPGLRLFRTWDGTVLVDVTHWAEVQYPPVPPGVDD